MSNGKIPEKDLPLATPGTGDFVRGVTATGASRRYRIGGPTGLATNEEMAAAVDEANHAVTMVMTYNPAPKFRAFGGQLSRLAEALANPLHQSVLITMCGDSITWGLSVPGNAVSTPRNGTMADPRDVYATKSYVNELKRYISSMFFEGAAATLSNWSFSSSGQSTAKFTKNIDMYPGVTPFTTAASGSSLAISNVYAASAALGKQYRLVCGNQAGTSFHTVTIPNFTGDSIAVVYSSNTNLTQDYQVYVDGVLLGTFTTDHGVVSYKNVRVHTFGYVKNKTIEIRSKYPAGATGNRTLYLEAIRIPKVCRITNQGVIGTEFRRYIAYNFGEHGPSITSENDQFYFVQLGTNSRGVENTDAGTPSGVNRMAELATQLFTLLQAAGDVIVMCANPCVPDAPDAGLVFTMGDVRSTLLSVAKTMNLDFIDNYSLFQGVPNDQFTADGIHPNEFGHSMIVKNIIGALELS